MKIKKLLSLGFIFLINSSHAADNSSITIYSIPGKNGFEDSEGSVRKLFNLRMSDRVVRVGTPKWFPDMGQSNCLSYLDKAIKQYGEGIVYATDQGTATALNYVAQHNTDKNIKALVLEAAMLSGNDALCYPKEGLANVPGAYYWLPYVSKLRYPMYWPNGAQPIKSLAMIPTDLPVVIAHFDKDQQSSFNNACALYYGLRSRGNNNVYFVSKNGSGHADVLCEDYDMQIINKILSEHSLIPLTNSNPVDLNKYQPRYEHFKLLYDDLLEKDKNHENIKYLQYPAGLVAAAGVTAALWKLSKK